VAGGEQHPDEVRRDETRTPSHAVLWHLSGKLVVLGGLVLTHLGGGLQHIGEIYVVTYEIFLFFSLRIYVVGERRSVGPLDAKI
jgi:hypothetical protein